MTRDSKIDALSQAIRICRQTREKLATRSQDDEAIGRKLKMQIAANGHPGLAEVQQTTGAEMQFEDDQAECDAFSSMLLRAEEELHKGIISRFLAMLQVSAQYGLSASCEFFHPLDPDQPMTPGQITDFTSRLLRVTGQC